MDVALEALDFQVVVGEDGDRVRPVPVNHALFSFVRTFDNHHPLSFLELLLQVLVEFVDHQSLDITVQAHNSHYFACALVDSAGYPRQLAPHDLHQFVRPDIKLHFYVFGLFLQKVARIVSGWIQLEYFLRTDGGLGTLDFVEGVGGEDEAVLSNFDVFVVGKLIVDEEIGLGKLLLGRPFVRLVGDPRVGEPLQNLVLNLHDFHKVVVLAEHGCVVLAHPQVDEGEADPGDELDHCAPVVEFCDLAHVVLVRPHLHPHVLLHLEVVYRHVPLVEQVREDLELDLFYGAQVEPGEVFHRLPDVLGALALEEDEAGKLLGEGQGGDELAEEVAGVALGVLGLVEDAADQSQLVTLRALHLVEVLLVPLLVAIHHLMLLSRVDLLQHVSVVAVYLLLSLPLQVLQHHLRPTFLTRFVHPFVVLLRLAQLLLAVRVQRRQLFPRLRRGFVVDELFDFFWDFLAARPSRVLKLALALGTGAGARFRRLIDVFFNFLDLGFYQLFGHHFTARIVALALRPGAFVLLGSHLFSLFLLFVHQPNTLQLCLISKRNVKAVSYKNRHFGLLNANSQNRSKS